MKEPLIKSLILFASMFFVAHGITQFFMVDYMDYLEKQRNQISLMSVVTRHHGDELEKKMPELVERMARNCNRTFGELERDADDFFAGMIGNNCFGNAGHADCVTSDRPDHSDLSRCLEGRS